MNNIDTLKNGSEHLTAVQVDRLLTVLTEGDPVTVEAKRKASEWQRARGTAIAVEDIIIAVDTAQDLVAADFEKWDEMEDDEKNDLAELLCALMVARDIVAVFFRKETKGRLEVVEEGTEE